MIQISSSYTIFFKLFIPLFWLVFFGGWYLGLTFSEDVENSVMNNGNFMMYFGIFIVLWMLFLYLTVWQLQRVDANDTFLVVTNYIKSYRYSVSNIVKVTSFNILFFKIKSIYFKDKGYFGAKVTVLVSPKRWSTFVEMEALDPSIVKLLIED